MTPSISIVPALLWLLNADPAAAPLKPAPPAVSAAPAAPAWPDAPAVVDGDDWSRRYQQARAVMFAGQFADAAERFAGLAADARDPGRATLARDQGDICQRWARGGLSLMRSADLAAISAKATAAPASVLDRRSADELGVLYTTAVLYGLGSGFVLDTWTEPSSPAAGILPALALGGAAAGLVYFLDRPQDMRYGVPQSITSGMWVGLEEGLAWMLWNQARSPSSEEWSARTVATALWGTATAGAVLGGTLGTAYGTTPGRASLMGSAALWSGLVAGLVGAAAVPQSATSDDTFMLVSALGLNLGAVGGVLLGADVSPSIARVRYLDLGGLAGGILAGGLYVAVANGHPSERLTTAVIAGGITAGLVTAWRLTSGMEPDYPRAGRPAPTDLSAVTPTVAPSASAGHGVDGLVLGAAGRF